MILSARDLKVRGVLCALQFVHVVDLSMSHGGRAECGMPTAPGLPLSVTLTGVCDSVDLASFQNITNGQFRGDGRTVRTLVFGVYKICRITGSYLWVIQKDITL